MPPFSWSHSKLEAFETCPKKYYHLSVLRDFTEEKHESSIYGTNLHEAAAHRLQHGYYGSKYKEYESVLEPWCEKIAKIGGPIFVEQKLAIDEGLNPVEWFAKPPDIPWLRGIADVIAISPNGKTALAVDWKTGKIKENSTQLAIMAECVFAHYPSIEAIRTEFIWLRYDASTREDFLRRDMKKVWTSILPRVQQLKLAHETGNFPAKPGPLCKRWCPVKSCTYCGR